MLTSTQETFAAALDHSRGLFDLTGRRAVVVGGGGGIGASVSCGLAAHGAAVTCADLDEAAAGSVRDAVVAAGGEAVALAVDVRAADAGARIVGELGGAPDVLVVAAAMNDRRSYRDMDDATFLRIVDLNLLSAFRVLRDVGAAMADAGRGSIVVFSSIRSTVVEPGQVAYAATKAGVVQVVRVLAAELGPHGVRVNAVAPGVVDTPLTAPIRRDPAWAGAYAAKGALGRWAQPAELIGPVVFLASDAASFVTGTELFADGGWTAVDGRFDPPLPHRDDGRAAPVA